MAQIKATRQVEMVLTVPLEIMQASTFCITYFKLHIFDYSAYSRNER